MILCILTLEELLAFLSYVPWSKYNLCILTITNILQYEVLATNCQKQSDSQVLYALHTEFVSSDFLSSLTDFNDVARDFGGFSLHTILPAVDYDNIPSL